MTCSSSSSSSSSFCIICPLRNRLNLLMLLILFWFHKFFLKFFELILDIFISFISFFSCSFLISEILSISSSCSFFSVWHESIDSKSKLLLFNDKSLFEWNVLFVFNTLIFSSKLSSVFIGWRVSEIRFDIRRVFIFFFVFFFYFLSEEFIFSSSGSVFDISLFKQ